MRARFKLRSGAGQLPQMSVTTGSRRSPEGKVMARALRPGTLGPTGTPTGTWQRGPGGLAPDDDGGGGLGPPVVAEVVLEVLLDEASLLVAHLGVGVLGGGMKRK